MVEDFGEGLAADRPDPAAPDDDDLVVVEEADELGRPDVGRQRRG